MAAVPQNATLSFVGASGRVYAIDVYCSDVANAAVTLSPNGSAVVGSPQYWRAPEAVTLYDFSINTGMTDTATLVLSSDGANVPGTALRYANFENTLANRAKVSLGFRSGALIGASQFA